MVPGSSQKKIFGTDEYRVLTKVQSMPTPDSMIPSFSLLNKIKVRKPNFICKLVILIFRSVHSRRIMVMKMKTSVTQEITRFHHIFNIRYIEKGFVRLIVAILKTLPT